MIHLVEELEECQGKLALAQTQLALYPNPSSEGEKMQKRYWESQVSFLTTHIGELEAELEESPLEDYPWEGEYEDHHHPNW